VRVADDPMEPDHSCPESPGDSAVLVNKLPV